MDLNVYLSQKGLKKKKFAELLGCSSSHFSCILNGKRQCSPQLARKIEAKTQGEVTASEIIFFSDKLKKNSEK